MLVDLDLADVEGLFLRLEVLDLADVRRNAVDHHGLGVEALESPLHVRA
jgi:hypothetical protein